MQISTRTAPLQRLASATPTAPAPEAAAPDVFNPDTMEKALKKPYEPWVPLANAAFVGGAFGGASALGAIEHSLFGAEVASAITAYATPVVFGLTAGYLAGKSAVKEFNGHPVLVGLSALTCGTVAAVASPFLKMPGAAYGWTGAAVATAVTAVGAGVISAFGIHSANQKIEHHNQLFTAWQKEHPPQA